MEGTILKAPKERFSSEVMNNSQELSAASVFVKSWEGEDPRVDFGTVVRIFEVSTLKSVLIH